MSDVLDARGLSCPLPVVMVQKEVKGKMPNELVVLLDAKVSVENVTRFATNQGYTVSGEELINGEYKLVLKK